jgi:hypothetical protein
MKRNLGGPAFVLALVALFVALGEGAVAAGIVPLARHAITARTASNALKLGGKTPKQLKTSLRGLRGPAGPTGATGPQGAAGSAQVSVHTQTFSLSESGSDGDSATVTATCGSGQKAVGGGYLTDGQTGPLGGVLGFESGPTAADDGWTASLDNIDGSAGHTGTVYAVCFG